VTVFGLWLGIGTQPQAATCTGECQKSGPLGLLVILLLCVACYFLFKSMSKHLKRVREDFPEAVSPAVSPAAAAPVDLVKRAEVIKRTDGGALNEPPAPDAEDVPDSSSDPP
jgi:hypothetical protein